MIDGHFVHNLELMKEYLSIMSPLVPSGKLALEFEGKPKRRREHEIQSEMLDLAKFYKLHRKLKYSQCGLLVNFNPGINHYKGSYLELNFDTVTVQESLKRMLIIGFLCTLIIFMVIKQH